MQVLERQFRAVGEQVETPEPGHGIEQAVTVAVYLWEAVKLSVSRHPPDATRPNHREDVRRLMALYRLAERTNAVLRAAAEQAVRDGEEIPDLGRLIEVQRECRGELLMPTARKISRRDPDGRTPEQIRDILLDRVTFSPVDGRPVIPPEATVGLPCPFDPEPAA